MDDKAFLANVNTRANAWELSQAGRHAEAADAYAKALANFQPSPGSELDQATVEMLRRREKEERAMAHNQAINAAERKARGQE